MPGATAAVAGVGGDGNDDLLRYIAQHVLVPPVYIVLLGSVSACFVNALCNLVARTPRVLGRSFVAWRRVLRLSTEAHVVTPPPPPPPSLAATAASTPQHAAKLQRQQQQEQQQQQPSYAASLLHKSNVSDKTRGNYADVYDCVSHRRGGGGGDDDVVAMSSVWHTRNTTATASCGSGRRGVTDSNNNNNNNKSTNKASCNDTNEAAHGAMYDSAAFFRVMDNMAVYSPTTPIGATMPGAGAASGAVAARSSSGSGNSNITTIMHVDDAVECPPAMVPAPVVAEALTRSLADVRREHQRVVFAYHPHFMMAAAVKSFVMLIVIQYHFDDIPGGWHRLCVCGTANVMSGLLMPVLEYAANVLLPLDPSPSPTSSSSSNNSGNALTSASGTTSAAAAATGSSSSSGGGGVNEDVGKDRALFAELLLSIARLELSSLSTVLVQGSLFVCFAAILLPVLLTLCVPGAALYVWLLLPPWAVYALLLRRVYYRSGQRLPMATSHRSVALALFAWELAKMTAMKVLTLWLLQWSLQSTLLLGLAFVERRRYVDALRYMAEQQLTWRYPHKHVSAFTLVCMLSQLLL